MTTATRLYIAGRYGRRHEFAAYAKQLVDIGYIVTSRWLLTNDDDADIDPQKARERAIHDLHDIDRADGIVVFTEANATNRLHVTGGRHVECGYALAKRKEIFIVGPAENIFYHLQNHRFDTWTDCYRHLYNWRPEKCLSM